MATRILLLPGLFNSGPDHWQSHWEAELPACTRVMQADWEKPRAQDWIFSLQVEIETGDEPCVLVSHSSSCALVALWAAEFAGISGHRVKGALLVAPSDSEAPSYPEGPTGFAPMPKNRLPFPSIAVASTNDEYVTMARAEEFARNWGSQLKCVGELGHINSTSKLGMWPVGLELLRKLL